MQERSKTINYVTISVCCILFAIAVIHFYWATGGHFATEGAIPTTNGKRVLNPSYQGTVLVAVCFIAMSFCVAITGGLMRLPAMDRIAHYCTWLIAIVFLLRAIGDFHLIGFFKTIVGTRFAQNDTLFYSPLSLIMATALFYIVIRRGK